VEAALPKIEVDEPLEDAVITENVLGLSILGMRRCVLPWLCMYVSVC
jgi:hypothetical protein